MSDDISHEDLDEIKKLIEGYIKKFDEIENNVSGLLKSSQKENLALEDYSKEIQTALLEARDKALSVGYIAISTTGLLIRRFRTASKLTEIFIHLLNSFVSLITRHQNLFKIDSVQFTISLNPSVVVIFKP